VAGTFVRLSVALLALGCAAAAPASARVIEFPMQLDHAFVRQRLIEQLFDGPEESTRVWQDPSGCNDVVLSHPQVSGHDGKLHVRADFDAKLGAGVGDWCFNATRRKGILDAALDARLHPSLPIVEFRVVNSDLYDADGAKRFTGALWDWVRSQVHPQLETLRLDLYQPIAELKAFLPMLFPESDVARVQQLIASISLADVGVAADAISVRVHLDAPEPAEKTTAAKPPEPALSPEEIARWEAAWRSWDGFLTFLIKHSSQEAGDSLRLELRETLLDARHDIVAILQPTRPRDVDPVRPLFLKTWQRLAPILRQLTTRLPGEAALHYLSLITAADAFTALEQLGPDYGVELSTDGLRRMARMVEPAPFTDPTAYSESVDAELRALFGFGPPLPAPEAEPAPEDGAEPEAAPVPSDAPSPPPDSPSPQSFRERDLAIALVAGKAERGLDRWIPTREELADYLPLVRDLLGTTAVRTQRKKVLPGPHAALFRNLVLATAWQESCWRQFIRKGGAPQPLTSSVGAVGIMQVSPHVWRGFYDVKSLRNSTKYNAQAGSEILHHYLVDYAIKKREDRVRNDPEDLARATYSAYNAGPRQLDRYRRSSKGKIGHRIDGDFWKKYQQIRNGNDLAVKSCFPGLAT